jgi:hypothetical protein
MMMMTTSSSSSSSSSWCDGWDIDLINLMLYCTERWS